METNSKMGLITPEWMESIRSRANRTKKASVIDSTTHTNALEIRQIANDGDIVTIEELTDAQEVIQIVHQMPDALQHAVIENQKVCTYDYTGNTRIETVVDEQVVHGDAVNTLVAD